MNKKISSFFRGSYFGVLVFPKGEQDICEANSVVST